MYILQSRHLQSSPFQLLNFLLNTARFSDLFKLSGNACQSSEPRNDTDSIPYVVVLAFGNCRVFPLLRSYDRRGASLNNLLAICHYIDVKTNLIQHVVKTGPLTILNPYEIRVLKPNGPSTPDGSSHQTNNRPMPSS